MSFHDIFTVEMSITEIASESSFLFMSPFYVFFEIVIECGFVPANMANFEITFLGMAISDVFDQALLECVRIVALVTFPRLLRFMLVHDVLLNMFVILKKKPLEMNCRIFYI